MEEDGIRYRRPKQRQAKVLMRDVARMAGVSTQTVSRYFRTPDTITAENRERISRAVAETGYFPNPAASSLSANRTNLVAVIVPTIDHSIFSEIVAGLTSVTEAANQMLLIAHNGYSVEKEEQLVERFLAYNVSGIALVGQLHSDRTREMLQRSGTPTVELLECDAPPIDMAVGLSNFTASYEITKGLIDRGRCNIGFISAPTDGNDRVRQRLKGYSAALSDAGLPILHQHIAHGQFAIENGARAFDEMYRRSPGIDAIVSNDILGLGVQLQCRRMNLSVPADVAITGFDNLELSSILDTRLTTIKMDTRAMGVAAGQKLLARQVLSDIDDPVTRFPYEILWRETTP
ncbi:hypothetical protein BOO69_11295 [Sulfitobacter alexandrii]|uniref:HTH lacI-type domain-containing protein n=1 Tax=Sulfitobacter alexandrii TaxID=1917485 RepID=A0A1J0WIB9_9RHOB|nr:LacI family DNA-binding transcriptional regulator [Sulfitobacter alexandrii]APE43928.1 hypothetical protein BOO69_11295 [Sulfitobacter alexandrii]